MSRRLLNVSLLAVVATAVSLWFPPAVPGARASAMPATLKPYVSEGETYLQHKKKDKWLVIVTRSGGEYYATFVDTRQKKTQKVEIGAAEVLVIHMAGDRTVNFHVKGPKHPYVTTFVWSDKTKEWRPKSLGR